MLDAHAFDFLAPAARPRADARLAALSERELEVLAAIGHGWTNMEIADRFRPDRVDGQEARGQRAR